MTRKPAIALFWLVTVLGFAVSWGIQHWPAILSFVQNTPRGSLCRVASISDGDTVRAACQGGIQRVRLHCCDAPETSQRPWGPESTAYLRRITPPTVRLVSQGTDRYGRTIGELFDGEKSINLAMVEAGQAAVYRQYCKDPRYFAAERRAKSARLGIWSKPGDHQRPWDYRRAQQEK